MAKAKSKKLKAPKISPEERKKLKQKERWGLSARKYCFQRETYQGLQSML